MRFLVLGPLEVTEDDGEPVPISGAKERTILADLISHAGQVVSVDELLEHIWGQDPPRTAEKTLGSYVSRLRRALEPGRSAGSTSDVIATRGDGYLLDVSDDQIDAIRFEHLAEEGRRLLDAGRPQDAGPALEQALGLWRGAAYQDHRYTGFGASEGERLDELRRSVLEDRIDTRLVAGDASAAIPDLEAMVREEPLRERRWGQLMLALYRAGRQAESLQAFVRARTVLVEELGIEPGPDLQRLQAAILAQDPELERPWPTTVAEPLSPTDVCPYKGLARFETSDAEFYFGREQLVAEAVGRLARGRFLALIGASGSGKSSLMRAGLLHAIGSGALPGSDGWTVSVMRPGKHPLESFNAALTDSGSRARTVLAVDQFEEAFTTCADDAERTAFFDAVTAAALVPDGAVTVVLAMRSDYYGRCADHRALASLLAASQILVGTMNEAELRRAIELPAGRAGLTVDHPLTDALVADSVGQPGGLPLLSTALLELWTRRRDRTLHFDDYLRTGGLEGAVARLAEDAYGRLDRDGQASAKRILLRLAESGDGKEVVSRRAPLSEFDLDRDGDAGRALAALTEARLVTVAEGSVEVAHEALLRDWPRLSAWLEDDAEGRRLHRHVTASARTWDEGGRDQGDLYRGARLAAALDWADAHEPDLNTAEREFLDSSRAASEGETLRARRTNRRLRGLLAGVAVLLALSLVVGDLALNQRDDARAAADVADARQLAARSLNQPDLDVSLLLAREAVQIDDSAQTRSALLAALQRDPAAVATMHAYGATPGDPSEWMQLSPDGHIIATGGAGPTVDLFDPNTYQRLGTVDVGSGTTTGAFSPDGLNLAVAAVDRRVVAIDVIGAGFRTSTTTTRDVDAILFAPDGGRLITAESKGRGGVLVPRDPVTLDPMGAPVHSETEPITAMDSSPDGRWLVTTSLPLPATKVGGHTVLWNEGALEQVGRQFPWGGNDVALSPDGQTAAIAAAEDSSSNQSDALKGQLVVLNLRTGKHFQRPGLAPHRGGAIGLTGLAFSADGRSLISSGADDRVLIWNLAHRSIERAFDDPAGLAVFTPALSPDASTGFTIDLDGNIVVWDLGGERGIDRSFTAGSTVPSMAVSPDGRTLAVQVITATNRHGFVQMVDTSTMETVDIYPDNGPASGAPEGLAFSPDGRTLAVSSIGGYVQLWDVATRTPDGPPLSIKGANLHHAWLWATAFSPDGSLLAAGGGRGADLKGVVVVWHVTTGQLAQSLPEQPNEISAINFTSDGHRLVASTGWGNPPGNAIVWNLDAAREERTIPADGTSVNAQDISNDGTTLVTAGSSGIRLWNLSDGQPIGPELKFPSQTMYSVDLSPDGRTLVAAGTEGQMVMWDVATGIVLGSTFPGPRPRESLVAAFSPDGHTLFVSATTNDPATTGEAWIWDVDPASWEARACQIVGRPLTEAEWQLNLPDRPYDPTCTA